MKKEILDCACYSIDHAYIITFDKDFDNENMVLKGSYNTLVALGTELGEIEVVNENGVTKVVKKEVDNKEKDNNEQ